MRKPIGIFIALCIHVIVMAKPITMRVALSHNPRSSWVKAMLRFGEDVEAKSNGRLKVELYHSGQLGSTREVLEMAYLGAIEAAVSGSAQLEAYVEAAGVVVLPYLWRSESGMFAMLDGELGDLIESRLNDKNMHAVCWFANGFRSLTNNRHPVTSPSDMAGLKIRVLPSPAVMTFFREIGASPVPIDWVELYEALKMGVVDAQENPPFFVYLGRIHEVQKYYSLTLHMNEPGVVVMHQPFYRSLDADLKNVVDESARSAAVWQRNEMQTDNAEMLRKIEEAIPVNALSEAQRDQFRRLANEKAYPEIIRKKLCGPDTESLIGWILDAQKGREE